MSIIFDNNNYDNFIKELKEQVCLNKDNTVILLEIINQLPEIVSGFTIDKSIIIRNNYIYEIINIFDNTVLNKEIVKRMFDNYNKNGVYTTVDKNKTTGVKNKRTVEENKIDNTYLFIKEYVVYFKKKLQDISFIIINILDSVLKDIYNITYLIIKTIFNIVGIILINNIPCLMNILSYIITNIIPNFINMLGYILKNIIIICFSILMKSVLFIKNNIIIQQNSYNSNFNCNNRILSNRCEYKKIYNKFSKIKL